MVSLVPAHLSKVAVGRQADEQEEVDSVSCLLVSGTPWEDKRLFTTCLQLECPRRRVHLPKSWYHSGLLAIARPHSIFPKLLLTGCQAFLKSRDADP